MFFSNWQNLIFSLHMFRLALKSTNQKNKHIFNLKNILFIGALASLTIISITLKTVFLFFFLNKSWIMHTKKTHSKQACYLKERINLRAMGDHNDCCNQLSDQGAGLVIISFTSTLNAWVGSCLLF